MQDITSFGKQFQESSIASIDAFLSRRNEYVAIGKFAIAAVLCKLEFPQRLYDPENDDNWYFELWNAMQAEAHDAESIKNNQIKFVTFNYDRSLEYFLYSSIKNTFSINEPDAKRIASEIPIKHVYGQIGDFFGPPNTSRPYRHDLDNRQLKIAANGIRIIPEARDDDAIFQDVKQWFREAKFICFLGFGFDKLNVSRLGLSGVIHSQGQIKTIQSVIASGYEKTDAELGLIGQDVIGGGTHYLFRPENEKNLMTLRKHAYLLR